MQWALLRQLYFNGCNSVRPNTCILHCDCAMVLPTVDNFHPVVNNSAIQMDQLIHWAPVVNLLHLLDFHNTEQVVVDATVAEVVAGVATNRIIRMVVVATNRIMLIIIHHHLLRIMEVQ